MAAVVGGVVLVIWGFRDVWDVIWTNMCTYHKSIYPQPVWVAGGGGCQ